MNVVIPPGKRPARDHFVMFVQEVPYLKAKFDMPESIRNPAIGDKIRVDVVRRIVIGARKNFTCKQRLHISRKPAGAI